MARLRATLLVLLLGALALEQLVECCGGGGGQQAMRARGRRAGRRGVGRFRGTRMSSVAPTTTTTTTTTTPEPQRSQTMINNVHINPIELINRGHVSQQALSLDQLDDDLLEELLRRRHLKQQQQQQQAHQGAPATHRNMYQAVLPQHPYQQSPYPQQPYSHRHHPQQPSAEQHAEPIYGHQPYNYQPHADAQASAQVGDNPYAYAEMVQPLAPPMDHELLYPGVRQPRPSDHNHPNLYPIHSRQAYAPGPNDYHRPRVQMA